MANKTFVAKNGLTANTTDVFMSQLSGTLTQASGGLNVTIDENGKVGTQTNAQIKSNIGAGVVQTVTAGNGLTGGGATGTVTVTMGAPTTLTVSTTDTVGSTTHAHAITTSNDVSGGTSAILASSGTGKLSVHTLDANNTLEIAGTALTSTAAELNLIDGSSAGTVVNSKAVVYGSSGEVNATTLQIGGTSITSTAAELNLIDGSGAGTVVNSKAVIYGSSGEVNATTLQIGGTSITSTAAELNILDGVNSTATELNIIDGDTSASPAVTIADADRFVLNDAGTMKQIAATDVANYVGANPADFSSAILPNASGTIDLGSAAKEFNDIFLADSSVIKFGNDQEITLTHNADKGLTLKHEATGDDVFPTFTLATKQTDIQANDVLGSLEFIAPDEGSGTADQDLLAGAIRVISEGDFSDTSNASKMSFMLGVSEAASEKMSLASNGTLTISGDLVVSGTTTTVSSTTIEVNDPLLFLAQNNTGSDTVDIGFFGAYDTSGSQDLFAGLFRDANDGKWKFFKDTQAEPTTTVNTSGTGYTAATVVAGTFEGNLTGNVTGNINGDLTGTLQTAAQGNVTSLGTLTTLTVDNVIVNGTTIGHTSDTNLMTLADGALTIDGTVTVGANDAGFDVILYGETASANMTWDASADDLILNGAAGLVVPDGQLTLGSTAVTATAAEINLIDGDTARGTTAVASGDGILINDAGTMRMTNVDTVSTYFSSHSVGGTNIVTTGALNAGSITSGFGTIDTGSSTITTTGAVSGGSFKVANEGSIGSAGDTNAILVGASGTVALTQNETLIGASNTSVAVGMTKAFSGSIGTSATEVVLTFKGADGTASATGATNYQGGEIVLTLKKGSDVETKKLMVHHTGAPDSPGTNIFITEFATLGTELGETIAVSMGDADGTSLTTNQDKHVHLKITNPSGTDAMTYAGVAHLVEIPGDS